MIPRRDGEPVRLGRSVDLAPQAAAADAHGAGVRIDGDVPEQREIADDAIVDAGEAAAVVTAGPDGERQVVVTREADHADDVVHVLAACDQRRSLVDHRVEERSRVSYSVSSGPISSPANDWSSARAACAGVVVVLTGTSCLEGRLRRYGRAGSLS